MKVFLKPLALLYIFTAAAYCGKAQNAFFEDALESSINGVSQNRVIVPVKYRTLQLNKPDILTFLNALPAEKSLVSRVTTPVISIPMPQGGFSRFHIWESTMMEPGLAAKFPDIKTFTGQGIDDPTASIKLDFTQFGFHAMILSSVNGAVFIDPYARGNTINYISYNKSDFKKNLPFKEIPPVGNVRVASRGLSADNILAASCIGTQLRTYRLALAATAEYTAAQGGTVAAAQAAQVTTMNRVNGVYERELDIRMILVANNNLLIYTDSPTDPYTNNDGFTMLGENQNNITAVIGSNNYDIGHVFSTGGGGIAGLGVVCIGNQKARGVTGSQRPVGDPFDIDYVAHEMGHQFGASHTFNSEMESCGGNGAFSSNAEPGSGTTIMAYAGICGSDDTQPHSDAQFHAISFNEITNYITNGSGNNCAVITATGNTPPVVNAGPDYIIPKSTPFVLTGSGSDANGDALTFSWEQINTGGPFGTWNNPTGDAPLFRSFVPKALPVRYFPQLADVINNATTKGEVLPTYARVLKFRLTGRDNKAGGGGVCFDESAVTVNENAGPFLVTYPNASGITWLVNEFRTITWDPSGTAIAPISCANVRIELSTDGGNTFPVTILSSTPNDGSEEIKVPANVTSSARIRVTAVGNVFYDMSNTNFSIQNASSAQFAFSNPLPVSACNGNTASTTLNTSSLNGFSTAISLSATGNPSGTTVSFGSNPVTPGSSTTVTLNNIGSLPGGTYAITVNGIAGAVTKSRVISFTVGSFPAAPSGLSAPANNSTGVTALPSFNWAFVAGTTYQLQISSAADFSTIVQTVNNISALPYTITNALTDNTVYYWRVSAVNGCGSGPGSATGIFKTGITTCKNSTDVPKVISEADTTTVTSTLTIPAAAGVTISDLNVVGLKGTHSYLNDLTVSLTSPAGTKVVLFDQVCPEGTSDFDLNLDDDATADIPCPATGGQTVKPQNPLSAFNGQNSTGVWTLTIRDNYAQDGGSLNGWGLTFNNCTVISTPLSLAPWTQLCPPSASTTLTSNLTGASYQWQVNIGGGFVNISNNGNYSGVNTATLQLTNAPSAWNGYQYRNVVNGNNSTVFTLGFTSTWNGSVSSAWENAANWSCNTVPDANTDVIVNTGSVIVNSNASCRSIKANQTSSVTVKSGFKVTVTH